MLRIVAVKPDVDSSGSRVISQGVMSILYELDEKSSVVLMLNLLSQIVHTSIVRDSLGDLG